MENTIKTIYEDVKIVHTGNNRGKWIGSHIVSVQCMSYIENQASLTEEFGCMKSIPFLNVCACDTGFC